MKSYGGERVWIPKYGWKTVKKKLREDVKVDGKTETLIFLFSFFRWYPDIFLDICRSESSHFATEELIQRVLMRTLARYQYTDITGCRGLTKTNSSFKERLTFGLLWPGTRMAYYGPTLTQMASIAKNTYNQLKHDYPSLTDQWEVSKGSTDAFEVRTQSGSNFTIAAFRGDNIHNVLAEEYAQEGKFPFDYDGYKNIVLPAVRLTHRVNGVEDPLFPVGQKQSITSAGRKQNHAFETRAAHLKLMQRGDTAFVADIPWQVVILSQIRSVQWVRDLKSELTPEEWMRECESRYSGTDSNPVVRDEVLTEQSKLMVAENHHCCLDPGCSISPKDVVYIVGYDVSYSDSKQNAKCACAVIKCTKQKDWFRRDRYLKQLVYVDDWRPQETPLAQARKIKAVWASFCHDEGNPTYLVCDAWQYGTSVVQALMQDIGDGLPPLCVRKHASFTELELQGALPILYPIKAGGVGCTDPDQELLRYAEMQFENRNVELLTSNINEGVEAYKKRHRIKDDSMDAVLAIPYIKTRDLRGQIMNLKKQASGATMKEVRISHHIQRDSWSALKYALRVAQILELEELQKAAHRKNEWATLSEGNVDAFPAVNYSKGFRGIARLGGRRYG